MTRATVVAIDIGAGSGRVMLGRAGPDRLALVEVHRFPNAVVTLASGLHWDVAGLFRELLAGLAAVPALLADGERVDAIGIDTWPVDYGLLDRRGELLGVPFSYRDTRTAAGVARVHERLGPAELSRRTALQHLPFNTVFQLAAEPAERLAAARTVLL